MKTRINILILIIGTIFFSSCEKEHDVYDSPILEKEIINNIDYSNDFVKFDFDGQTYNYKRDEGINSGFIVWELSNNDFYIERELASPDGMFNLNITFPSDTFGMSYAYNYMKYNVYNYKQTESKEDNNNNGKFGTCFQVRDINNIVFRSIQTNDIDSFYNKINSITLIQIYKNEAFFSVEGIFTIKVKSVNTNNTIEKIINNGSFSVIVSTKVK
ncbi:MAG: hypothetical protein A2X12_01070 [Bacteroidetes bacterium GWE2_29_8]|nr:MAG: hypothetical protein A2X12_01070 [Bacteroidetes bacterium GWE2_29_8]OFY14404.1 MAG: hypothetical protein A2X02_01205 [Bacteroidetes bacterium GWF2_29_10]